MGFVATLAQLIGSDPSLDIAIILDELRIGNALPQKKIKEKKI